MMSARRWGMGAALGMIAGMSAGCAGDGASGNGPETGEASAKVARERAGHERGDRGHGMRGRFARGPAQLLVVALRDLELTDAQRGRIEEALKKLKTDLEGHAEGPKADGEGPKALAAAVRAGKIDEAALAPKGAGRGGHAAAFAAALGTLHSTLTKAQREELVAIVEQQRGGHEGASPKGHRGERADLDRDHERGDRDGWTKGKGKGKGKGNGKGKGLGQGGPLRSMLADLELTDPQKEALDQALEAERGARPENPPKDHPKQHHAEMKARLASFASDTFDASAFAAPPGGGPGRVGDPRGRFVRVLAKVVPLLDSAQREKLATAIEEGSTRRGHAKGRMHGRGGKRH